MNSLVGQSLGRYHLTEKLGEGGMAIVYRGFDTRLERDVAVKVIRPEFVQFEDFLARFEREAKALAQLTHPNIVHINDFGEHDGLPYLVMDYLPGGTLKEKLNGPMPFQKAVRILLPIARALEYAHEMKIVHRDVKPANILLTKNGQPMLTDFGLAKILETKGGTTLTSTGVGIGTPDYMAPEQWLGKTCPQTDMYALGVVFYEMITGQRPYTADTPAAVLLKQANEPLPEPGSFVKDIPQSVEHFIYKVLAKEPENRFSGMPDFIKGMEKLERMADTLQVPTAEEPAVPDSVKTPKTITGLTRVSGGEAPRKTIFRRPIFWILLAVVLGGLAFGVWYFWEDIFYKTEEWGETSPPPELLTTIFADDFEDPLYNDYFNEKVWDFWGGTLISVYQLDGEMHFLAPPAENEGALLVARGAYEVIKTNYFQAEVNLAYYAKKGFGTASLTISSEDESRWIECQFVSDGNEFICFEENEAGDQVVFIQDEYFDQDSWYFTQIIIDPHTFQVDVYLEETLLGSYTPEQADFWKNSPLRFSLGAYIYRTESEFYADFDNVWVGSQFDAPQVFEEKPQAEPENTPLVSEQRENPELDDMYSPVASLEHDLALGSLIQDTLQVPAVKQEMRFVLEDKGVTLTSLFYLESLDIFVRSRFFNLRDFSDEVFFDTNMGLQAEPLQLPQIGDNSVSFAGQDVGEGTEFPGMGIRFAKGEIRAELLLMGPQEKLKEGQLLHLAEAVLASFPQELAETNRISAPLEGLEEEIFHKYLNSFELGTLLYPEENFAPQNSFVSSEQPICFHIDVKEPFQPVTIAIYNKKLETYVYKVVRLLPVLPGNHQVCYPTEKDLKPGNYVYRLWLEGSQVVDIPFDVLP